ncbi:MAG: FliH/SctL family protein [Immundisolibacter sp.]|uniref:FliH/SctL family protein n=1 Tax=Immundisolibacter sp. TaxID=1934948 RepID=UPI003D108177
MSSKPFQRWQAVSPIRPQAVDPRVEQAREAGHAEGYAAGLTEGITDGRARAAEALAAESAHLTAVLDSLAQPLATLEQELHDNLLQLACALARQVVRRELTAVPQRIGELVREGVAALPPAARQISVHLNPLDLDLVRGISPRGRSDVRWELVADTSLTRGGCRIVTESSEVDLTLEARLGEVFSRLMEGEA